jgi:hypothetical protein
MQDRQSINPKKISLTENVKFDKFNTNNLSTEICHQKLVELSNPTSQEAEEPE